VFYCHGFSVKQGTAFTLLMAGMLTGAQAGSYSSVFFFGDSLTDSGVYAPLVGVNDHFSTNPGTVWSQNLGASYGKSVTPAYAAAGTGPGPYAFNGIGNGNNFAVGSALINAAAAGQGINIPPVSGQVNDILARGPLASKALYAISGGHNDVFTQLSGGAGAIPGIVTAAHDLTAQIVRLQSAGARNLIVIGIMDLTKAPIAALQTPADQVLLGNLVTTFDATLDADLAGKNLLYFNTGRLLNTVISNPMAYGFTNTTDPACGPLPTVSLGCSPPAGTGGYLFADVRHPSAKFHRIISDWIYTSLEGASRVGLMSQVPLGRSGAQWRSIDGRLNEFQNYGYKGQGFFVTGDYANSQKEAYAGVPSADGSGGSLIIGYEKAFAEQLFGGITLGYGNAPFDLGNSQGTVKYNDWSLSTFASYKFGSFYANGIATYSWLDYASKRNISLGPFNTSERGDTRGHQSGVKGQIGYHFTHGDIIHGPLVGLAWERVNVDGFSEQSNSLTAMTFGDQTRESLRSRLGWQVAAETRWAEVNVRPYAQLSYDYEHKKDERSYSAGFVGGNSAMEISTANRTGGYGTLLAGINAELSHGMRLGFGASATISQPGAKNSAVNITLSAPF
jgi:outer membrane lipase/esterase